MSVLARQQIAQLDRQIARKGETVSLQRQGDRNEANFKAFRAFVRGYKADELNGGIMQGDSLVTISPTDLAKAGITDPIQPQDRIHVGGRPRNVKACNPVRTNDVIVRWDAWVQGGN